MTPDPTRTSTPAPASSESERFRGSKDALVSADFVRRLLDYDAKTGVFTWTKTTKLSGHIRPGCPAGYATKGGYHSIRLRGAPHQAHRLAWLWMTGEWPAEQIDHIDCDRTNNRWSNLRLATFSQQQMNRPVRRTTKSGFKGVYECPGGSGKWQARIRVGGISFQIGTFPTKELAHEAYVARARVEHGEYMAPLHVMRRGDHV